MGLQITVQPTHEPVTLEEVKIDRRITDDAEEQYLAQLNVAARQYVEDVAGRQFVNATYAYTLDSFPGEILTPRPPLVSVTSIQYVDTDGTTQTLGASVYTALTDDLQAGRIVEAYNQSWPATRESPNAVTVTYVAGYGTGDSVPAGYKKAILLLVGEMYEWRETVAERAAKQLPTFDRLVWIDRVVTVA